MIKNSKRSVVLVTSIVTMLIFGMIACVEKNPTEIMGYAPVYGNPSQMHEIKSMPARAIVNGGKIYQYSPFTFQIENGVGIHVINSSNPSNPQKIGFIQVAGCSEIAAQNGILYTDNYRDLVALNITNINSVVVESRLEKVFPGVNQQMPPYAGEYFECVDPTKGEVIGWTEKLLIKPKCKR